jgi:succinate dehydrogenase hydrophobic anchor subunit
MEDEKPLQYRKRLQWGEHDPHRRENTMIGMWAWLAQRVSAVALVVLVVLHLVWTYQRFIQLLLLLTIAFHGALGVRVMLLDFNIVPIKYHRALIWGLTALGLAISYHLWRTIY